MAFSYNIRYVQDTIGARALFWKLSINQRRKSHKPFCGELCEAGADACAAGSGCRFIHVDTAGVTRRRPWGRRVGTVTTPDPDWLLKVCGACCFCVLFFFRAFHSEMLRFYCILLHHRAPQEEAETSSSNPSRSLGRDTYKDTMLLLYSTRRMGVHVQNEKKTD